MVYLTYRIGKSGRRYGPYGMRSFRRPGCRTPRQEYLGRVVVKEGIVFSERTGEALGQLQTKKRPVERSTSTPTRPEVLRLFYVPGLTHQFIDDILDHFPGQEDNAREIISSLRQSNVLREASPGLYWRPV